MTQRVFRVPVQCNDLRRRPGFSLLEVMLATAVLASSALVLSSLLGQGTQFGSRAEERTQALSQAQSLMDEFLALPAGENGPQVEVTGELEGRPPRVFRISGTPAPLGTADNLSGSQANQRLGSRDDSSSRLWLVTVEILKPTAQDGAERSLCRLSRLVRRHRVVHSGPLESAGGGGTGL